MIDIDEARDKVLWGRERRRVMDDAEKRLVAWHEAGHAIVQAVLDDGTMPVHKVTIIPRGQSLGSTTYLPTKDILTQPKKKLLNQIAMAMGGRIAEEMVTGDFSNGVYGDLKQATRIRDLLINANMRLVVNIAKKHTKPRQKMASGSQTPTVEPGGILDIAAPMAVSKVAVICPKCDRPVRIKAGRNADGAKLRLCGRCSTPLPSREVTK
jgi:ribosomal protein L24